MSIQAMKQALVALEVSVPTDLTEAKCHRHGSAISALRAAIAAAEKQEPVRCCKHDSDCAVHNEPAYPAGPCDCSVSEPVCYLREEWMEYVQSSAADPHAFPVFTAPQPEK